jgi:hypothetical protein
MPHSHCRTVVYSMAFLLCAAPIAAQSYHLEFVKSDRGWVNMRLMNDSDKLLVAFMHSTQCPNAIMSPSSKAVVGGMADSMGGHSSLMHSANGSFSQKPGIERGGWWEIGKLATVKVDGEDRECEEQMDVVLFADGTYEGSEADLQSIKAHRDGVAASVMYWFDRFNRENPDGSTLETLRTELKQVQKQDSEKSTHVHALPEDADGPAIPPERWYWLGKQGMDDGILAWFPPESSTYNAPDCFRRVTGLLNERKTEIDSDEAQKKLAAIFPVPAYEENASANPAGQSQQ